MRCHGTVRPQPILTIIPQALNTKGFARQIFAPNVLLKPDGRLRPGSGTGGMASYPDASVDFKTVFFLIHKTPQVLFTPKKTGV